MHILGYSKLKISTLAFLIILSSVAGYGAAKLWYAGKQIFISGNNPASQLVSLVSGNVNLVGEKDGQINFLLLGMAGEGHDGPYLSDTIIVASLRPQTNEVTMISLPRDLLVEIPGATGRYKINSVYALSMAKGKKTALSQTLKVAENVTGLDIPYGVVIDFNGFEKAIDTLGGVSVVIDEDLVDYYYPNGRNGYLPAVRFRAGVEHMDGKRALMYARSRQTTSDFHRAHRQQRILEAVNAKIKELNWLKDARTINRLFRDFSSNVSTNLDPVEIKRLVDLTAKVPSNQIHNDVLDPTTGMVCSYLSNAYGYHLQPCPGKNWRDIHQFVSTNFARLRVSKEKPIIEIHNATRIGGLATMAGNHLNSFGFKNSQSFTASSLSDSSRTIVYDLTNGEKKNSLAVLLTTFSATLSQNPPPHQGAGRPDFIVVLGQNYSAPNLETINLDPPPPPEEDEDEEEDSSSSEEPPIDGNGQSSDSNGNAGNDNNGGNDNGDNNNSGLIDQDIDLDTGGASENQDGIQNPLDEESSNQLE